MCSTDSRLLDCLRSVSSDVHYSLGELVRRDLRQRNSARRAGAHTCDKRNQRGLYLILSLFRHEGTWRLGNGSALYLFHHVSSDHLEELLLLPCHLPWFRVENTERPNRKTIRPAQGNASVKPQATLFHKRVVCEAGISRQVAHDQYFIFGDNVTAKGNVARSGPSLGKIGRQSGLRFEPL